MKYCPNCGERIDEKAVICPKCGVPIKKNIQIESQSVTQFLIWGWISAIVSLFIPVIGAASIVLGYFTIKRHRTGAGIALIIVAVVFIYLGLTGFGTGFISGFNKAR